MKKLSLLQLYRGLNSTLIFITLLGLPLTSFPFIIKYTGSEVAPFSAIPIAMLLIVWFIPFIVRRGKLPVESVPLIYFVLICVAVTGLGLFMDGFYSKDKNFLYQSTRAFVTLGVGLSFYLIFATWEQDLKTYKQTLQILYLTGGVLILWSLVEGFLLAGSRAINLPKWMLDIKNLLVVQSPNVLYSNRISGLAFEPSWFVRLFNLIFFPIWLSSVYQRRSIFKFRLWKFIVEDGLLVFAFVVFVLAAPRIGMLALVLMLTYLSFLFLQRVHKNICLKLIRRFKSSEGQQRLIKSLVALAVLLTFLILMVAFIFGFMTFAAQWDWRYALFFDGSFLSEELQLLFPLTEDSILTIGHKLAFQERLIYWITGWEIFNDYPMGVGLGNAGFYFWDRAPGIAHNSLEMRNLVYRAGFMTNTKNIWVRLLAESGIFGFALFTTWLYIVWRSAHLIQKGKDSIYRIMGLAGKLFIFAYLVEGFSMDSFAMPYLWVMTGLIASGSKIYRQGVIQKETIRTS